MIVLIPMAAYIYLKVISDVIISLHYSILCLVMIELLYKGLLLKLCSLNKSHDPFLTQDF